VFFPVMCNNIRYFTKEIMWAIQRLWNGRPTI
jgi:hypothetical protein